MDSITHLTQKILAERARHQPAPKSAPPPYTTYADMDEDEQDEDEESSVPLKLTINAAHAIHGSNNLVPTSPTTLADATKLSAVLMAAINQLNQASDAASALESRKRTVHVDLTINCGITIVGDRNVVGNVGVRPKLPASAVAGPGAAMGDNAVVGAKRKAEEEPSNEPGAKRLETTSKLRPSTSCSASSNVHNSIIDGSTHDTQEWIDTSAPATTSTDFAPSVVLGEAYTPDVLRNGLLYAVNTAQLLDRSIDGILQDKHAGKHWSQVILQQNMSRRPSLPEFVFVSPEEVQRIQDARELERSFWRALHELQTLRERFRVLSDGMNQGKAGQETAKPEQSELGDFELVERVG